MEVWKTIKETNGDYKISNYGNVKSRRSLGRKSNNHKVGEWKMLKPSIGRNRYYYVTIRFNNDGKRRKCNVHRLVARYFLPKKPEGDHIEVNHKDSNRLNNRVDNLEWVTSSGNTEHAVVNNRLVPWNHPRKPIIAVNIETGEEIRFKSISKAELYFGTRKIVEVLKGRRKSAKGYTYRYDNGGDENAT